MGKLLTNESTIGDTQGGCDLGGEINVTGRVNQVDQKVSTVRLLALDVLQVLAFWKSGVERDSRGLDGNTTCFMSVPCRRIMMPRGEQSETYAPARRHECRWHEHHQPFRWR